MRVDATCLIRRFSYGVQVRSLLIRPNVKIVFAKMTLGTSRTDFVFTHQACTSVLAE